MPRTYSKTRTRQTHEWIRGVIANVGTISPLPYDIIFHHIREKSIYDIIKLFFDNSTQKVDLLDQCVLEQFWWVNTTIVSARYSKIEHPSHYSGEYIFDKSNNERTIIEIRQPDIDGKHWRADHIHIKRGTIDPDDVLRILRPTFNAHIELTSTVIQGIYIMKMPSTT